MKNFGKYFEELINKTIRFYNSEEVCFLFKYSLKVISLKNKNKISIGDKGNLDYYGVFKGQFIAIEAKSVKTKETLSKTNFSNDQIIKIKSLLKLKAQVFIFIYFVEQERFFVLGGQQLLDLYQKNPKIKITTIAKLGQEIEIIFPGILNLELFFESIIV